MYVFGNKQILDQPIWIDAGDTRKCFSLRTMLQWVKCFAVGLDKLGIKPGDVVLAYSPNHVFVPVAYFGIAGSQRIFSGANPAYSADGMLQRAQILDCSLGLIREKNSLTKFETLWLRSFWFIPPLWRMREQLHEQRVCRRIVSTFSPTMSLNL